VNNDALLAHIRLQHRAQIFHALTVKTDVCQLCCLDQTVHLFLFLIKCRIQYLTRLITGNFFDMHNSKS
jgi:hypothetical protein